MALSVSIALCVNEDDCVLVDEECERSVGAGEKPAVSRFTFVFVSLFCLNQRLISFLEIYVCICAEMFPVRCCVCSCSEVPLCVA